MDWWQMLLAGIPSLLSGILLYEWEQQRKHSKAEETEKEQKHAALVKGVEALLRDRLIIGMEECINKGCCTSRGRCGNPLCGRTRSCISTMGARRFPCRKVRTASTCSMCLGKMRIWGRSTAGILAGVSS